MSISKKIIAAGATLGVVGSLGLAGGAMADTGSGTYPPIVDKIATKFNLNKDEVKKVFEEQKTEHQAEHKQKLEEKLAQAVKDGKLTEDQKTKLIAKLDEMHKNRIDAQAEATKEDREAKRAEFEKWAEDNGINLDEVLPNPADGRGPRGHRPF